METSLCVCCHDGQHYLCHKTFEVHDAQGFPAGVYRCDCATCKARRDRKNAGARARHHAMTGLGLQRVRGGLGGVYYE